MFQKEDTERVKALGDTRAPHTHAYTHTHTLTHSIQSLQNQGESEVVEIYNNEINVKQ